MSKFDLEIRCGETILAARKYKTMKGVYGFIERYNPLLQGTISDTVLTNIRNIGVKYFVSDRNGRLVAFGIM